MNLKALIISCAFLYSHFGFGSTVEVNLRSYVHSCGYYSNRVADFKISYLNQQIPWGSKVYLINALNGVQNGGTPNSTKRIDWQRQEEIEISAQAPFLWEAELSKIIDYRSSSTSFDALVFVFRIVLPALNENGVREIFDMGSDKPWSYYQVNIPYSTQCVTGMDTFPNFAQAMVLQKER